MLPRTVQSLPAQQRMQQPFGFGAAPQPQQPPATPQAPGPDGTLPTNTRQSNLEQVQQAYQQRMPGDMGFLNGLLQQSSQPVSTNDASLLPSMQAGRIADQRNFDRQRAALAERLGASGYGDSGAMSQGTGKLSQQMAETQAMRESGLVQDETNARRQALLSALGMDQSRYGADNDMGYRLAALQAQLNQNAVQPFF